MNLEKEYQLISNLKKGSEAAYREIFERYFSSLLYYAKEYVLDQEVAREIVQETFLKFWENRHILNKEFNIRMYLLKITRNTCLNYLRHLKVESQFAKENSLRQRELHMNYTALKDKSAEMLIYSEVQQKLSKALEKMPPKCRQVFELSRFEENSYREIAEKLEISVKTIENQINKALKIVKTELKEYLPLLIFLIM